MAPPAAPPRAARPAPGNGQLPLPFHDVTPYFKAQLPDVDRRIEPHTMPRHRLAELVRRIVAQEGPIHLTEVARRVAEAFGRERAGRRLVEATRAALQAAHRTWPTEVCHDENTRFWMTAEQRRSPPVRDRSNDAGTIVRAEAIAQVEIRRAIELVRSATPQAQDDEVIRSTARLLGFRRTGHEIFNRIRETLERNL